MDEGSEYSTNKEQQNKSNFIETKNEKYVFQQHQSSSPQTRIEHCNCGFTREESSKSGFIFLPEWWPIILISEDS